VKGYTPLLEAYIIDIQAFYLALY